MARYEGENVTNHVMGSAAPFAGVAMSQPLGVIALFLLLCFVCVLFAIVQGLRETVGTWGPYALALMAGAVLYGAHRWLWAPLAENPRTPRLITGSILLVAACTFELATGRGGFILGDVTGYNPEAALMDAGYPVGDGIRKAIEARRESDRQSAHCMRSLAAGNMSKGTSESVNWAMNCSAHIPIRDQEQACRLLDAKKGNDLDYVNQRFCRSINVYVTHRRGANPSY